MLGLYVRSPHPSSSGVQILPEHQCGGDDQILRCSSDVLRQTPSDRLGRSETPRESRPLARGGSMITLLATACVEAPAGVVWKQLAELEGIRNGLRQFDGPTKRRSSRMRRNAVRIILAGHHSGSRNGSVAGARASAPSQRIWLYERARGISGEQNGCSTRTRILLTSPHRSCVRRLAKLHSSRAR